MTFTQGQYKDWRVTETDWERCVDKFARRKRLVADKNGVVLQTEVYVSEIEIANQRAPVLAYEKMEAIRQLEAKCDEYDRNEGHAAGETGLNVIEKINALQHKLYGNATR